MPLTDTVALLLVSGVEQHEPEPANAIGNSDLAKEAAHGARPIKVRK